MLGVSTWGWRAGEATHRPCRECGAMGHQWLMTKGGRFQGMEKGERVRGLVPGRGVISGRHLAGRRRRSETVLSRDGGSLGSDTCRVVGGWVWRGPTKTEGFLFRGKCRTSLRILCADKAAGVSLGPHPVGTAPKKMHSLTFPIQIPLLGAVPALCSPEQLYRSLSLPISQKRWRCAGYFHLLAPRVLRPRGCCCCCHYGHVRS